MIETRDIDEVLLPTLEELLPLINQELNPGWNQFLPPQDHSFVQVLLDLTENVVGYKVVLWGSSVDVRYNVVRAPGQVGRHSEGLRPTDLTANVFLSDHGDFFVDGDDEEPTRIPAKRGRVCIFNSLYPHWSQPLKDGQPDRHTFIVQARSSE